MLVIHAQGPVPQFLTDANMAIQAGRLEEAGLAVSTENLDQLRVFVDKDLPRIDLAYMVVKVLLALGRTGPAEPWCRMLARIDPGHLAWYHLALVLLDRPGHAEEALDLAERAYEAEPSSTLYLDAFVAGLLALGLIDRACDVIEAAVRVHGLRVATLEALLGRLLYVQGTERRHLARGYGLLGQVLSKGRTPYTDHRNDPDPDRRIRVGFLSPDFRRNSTAIAFEVFLDGLDRAGLEVVAYGAVAKPDAVTQRLAEKVDLYVDVAGQDPEAVAARIRADHVDLLVDLGGYVEGHCMEVMALQPAPVQADFGWVTTTGLPQIRFRLSDGLLDPPDQRDEFVEQTLDLVGGMACYRPPEDTGMVGPLPALAGGFVTFGSFNRLIKITDAVLCSWARILRAVPASRLVVKSPSDTPEALRSRIMPRLQGQGVGADRVEFHGHQAYLDYLELFNRIDLGLDTFPFNGCIGTMEALWMGVPVVTRTGDLFVSRMGLDVLSPLGLEVFCARSDEEYVAKAVGFAGQVQALDQIRKGLRALMLRGPLCDPRRLASAWQAAFRQMWRQWCDEKHSRISERGMGV